MKVSPSRSSAVGVVAVLDDLVECQPQAFLDVGEHLAAGLGDRRCDGAPVVVVHAANRQTAVDQTVDRIGHGGLRQFEETADASGALRGVAEHRQDAVSRQRKLVVEAPLEESSATGDDERRRMHGRDCSI